MAWKAALIQGLLSGTASTIVITLGAPRIGRARSLDWMEIGTVMLRADSIRAEPEWWNIVAGIFVHQAADLSWAIVFFALGRYWTARLSPGALLLTGLPWAVATSAIEYYVVLPRLQPLVVMQVPYWTALGVHITSGLLYPFYPYVRARITGDPAPGSRFARSFARVLMGGLALLVALELLARVDRTPRWAFESAATRAFEQRFIHHMTTHHETGVALARLAAARATDEKLRMLGQLMIANQSGEIRILRQWWRSWVRTAMPELSEPERLAIPGMPRQDTIQAVAREGGMDFDTRFVQVMVAHHRGAISMADEAWKRATDPRVRLLADSLRHAQRGQIQAMLEIVRH